MTTRYISLSIAHVKRAVSEFASWFIILCALFLVLRCAAMVYDRFLHGRLIAWWEVLLTGMVKDLIFLMTLGAWAFLAHLLVSLLSEKLARVMGILTAIFLCLVHILLLQYFLTTLTMLGADLWYYSLRDVWQTVSAASIKLSGIAGLIIIIGLVVWSLAKLPGKINPAPALGIGLIVLLGISQGFDLAARSQTWRNESSEYGNSFSNNTSYYFYKQSLEHFFPAVSDEHLYTNSAATDDKAEEDAANFNMFRYADEKHYPFLHTDDTKDVLSPFFRIGDRKPNIVIVLLEGMGRAYANEGAYHGSFTPFLDSLSGHCLYWKNFLSQAGRTFAVLPSMLASLPFGKTGFTELDSRMPDHLSLLSLLKHNGYETSFYYGGDSQFDNMAAFLQKNAVDHIYDVTTFPQHYEKLPLNDLGFNWGYGDRELFRFCLDTPVSREPYCKVLLTVTSHEPFLVPDQQQYFEKFEQRMKALGLSEERKEIERKYKRQYATILYADEAVRQFLHDYAQRPDYNNTIFIITGDHRMPEIPLNNKLSRYHVPMLIYSPLLNRTAKFSSVGTHLDVTPSLLQLLKHQYQLETPSMAAWLGKGLDTGTTFANDHACAFMQSKHYMIDFIQGEHMLIGSDLYHIKSDMTLEPVQDNQKQAQLQRSFERFKRKNRQMIAGARLLPDSILQRYLPK